MTPEQLEQNDNELSFIISCLYQRGEDEMARTLEENVSQLFDYIHKLENS
jgi:hypothetical protein